jgi:hypothetical protein
MTWYQEARRAGAVIVCVTSGGKLAEMAGKDEYRRRLYANMDGRDLSWLEGFVRGQRFLCLFTRGGKVIHNFGNQGNFRKRYRISSILETRLYIVIK